MNDMPEHSKSKSLRIAEELRLAIKNGKYRSGGRLPSSRELGKEFNVSYITANRSLNILAEEGLAARNKRGATFVSAAGNGVRKRRIAILDIEYILSIWNTIAERGRNMLVNELHRRNYEAREISADEIQNNLYLETADCILVGFKLPPKQEEQLLEYKIPVIRFREEHIYETKFHQLTIDLSEGFRQVFKTVSPKKYKGVIIVSEKSCMWPRRTEAERQALAAGFQPEQIEHVYANDQIFELNYPIWKQLAKNCRNKFIFCCGDLLATGLISILLADGIRPGADYMLASYDNMEVSGYCPFGRPVIPSVGFSRTLQAEVLTDFISNLVENKRSAACRHIVKIPTFFVNRNTELEKLQQQGEKIICGTN